jgi:hypothetical protein
MTDTWEDLRARARAAEDAEEQLEFLRGEVARLCRVRDERGRELKDEASDVEEAESFSLSNCLAKWIGTRATELAREREEWIEARLRFEQVKDELAKLGARVRGLEVGVAERESVRAALAASSAARQAALVARGGVAGRRLQELVARMERRERRLRKLVAALGLCTEASADFAAAVDALDEGYGFAAVDAFTPRGSVHRSAHQLQAATLDRAYERVRDGTVALRQVDDALGKVGLRIEPNAAIPTRTLGDWFLDGLLFDGLKLRRVTGSRARVAEMRTAAQALERRLQSEATSLEHELARDRRLLEERLEG